MAFFERQGELNALRKEQRHILDELDDLEELMKRISTDEAKLAEGLDATLANVRAKMDRLPPNSLFRETHYALIQNALRGSNCNKLFAETNNGIENSTRKKRQLEQRLSAVRKKIAALEAEAMEESENG